MKHLLSKAWRKALRTTYAMTGVRPTSYPYISGDGFRALADHVHETGRRFDVKEVREGDIVFVESGLIHGYFSNIHRTISKPYVLITHNGDMNIGPSETSLMDEKIIHWFAQNALVEHPKLTPIPIGLENAHYVEAGRTSLIRRASAQTIEKNDRILVAFTPHTNPQARTRALEDLRNNPRADICEQRMSQGDYLEILKAYGYVASPPGNGEDCHRTWEALYVGTTPIVQASVCMKYFKKISVPVLVLESWKNTPEAPTRPLTAIDQDSSPIFFNYWKRIISESAKNHEHE
jgi:hypothetical protein